LRLGTANDFARTLRIPTDLERACETGAQGKVVDVDLGAAGENYHVNVTYVGLGAEVTQALYSPECVEGEFSEVCIQHRRA
jgi:diacylglycerol kinase (ATP)